MLISLRMRNNYTNFVAKFNYGNFSVIFEFLVVYLKKYHYKFQIILRYESYAH